MWLRSFVLAFALVGQAFVGVASAEEPYDESDSGVVRRQLARMHIDAGLVGAYDLDTMHRARLVLRAVDDDEWRGHTLGIGAMTAGAMSFVLTLAVAPTVDGGCTPDRCRDSALAVSIVGVIAGVAGLVLALVAALEHVRGVERLARWGDAILDGSFAEATW